MLVGISAVAGGLGLAGCSYDDAPVGVRVAGMDSVEVFALSCRGEEQRFALLESVDVVERPSSTVARHSSAPATSPTTVRLWEGPVAPDGTGTAIPVTLRAGHAYTVSDVGGGWAGQTTVYIPDDVTGTDVVYERFDRPVRSSVDEWRDAAEGWCDNTGGGWFFRLVLVAVIGLLATVLLVAGVTTALVWLARPGGRKPPPPSPWDGPAPPGWTPGP